MKSKGEDVLRSVTLSKLLREENIRSLRFSISRVLRVVLGTLLVGQVVPADVIREVDSDRGDSDHACRDGRRCAGADRREDQGVEEEVAEMIRADLSFKPLFRADERVVLWDGSVVDHDLYTHEHGERALQTRNPGILTLIERFKARTSAAAARMDFSDARSRVTNRISTEGFALRVPSRAASTLKRSESMRAERLKYC